MMREENDGLRRLIEYAKREARDQRQEATALLLELAVHSLIEDNRGQPGPVKTGVRVN